jgi:hypothetical protein
MATLTAARVAAIQRLANAIVAATPTEDNAGWVRALTSMVRDASPTTYYGTKAKRLMDQLAARGIDPADVTLLRTAIGV